MYKPIGITMGDPAGIGPELVSKLLLTDQKNILVYTNFECLKKFAPTVNLNDPRLVNVIGDFDIPNLVSGKPSSVGGHISLTILKRAVDDCINDEALCNYYRSYIEVLMAPSRAKMAWTY